ncbi:hypothetical protein OPIT5_28530 [Opitutaceae bacterium TAV5]|nr:hypothetical protein OPIT5_28530 [Opitutaceae bacterium TAV5]
MIDDHLVVSGLVENFISSLGNYAVVARVVADAAALEAVERHNPHLVIMELSSPTNSAPDLLCQIRQSHPDTRVLIFSGDCSLETVRFALEAGVHGYVSKTASFSEFQQAIKTIAEGGIYFSSLINAIIVKILQNRIDFDSRSPFPLSQRELGILRLMASGLSTKEIAASLGISPFTVANHRAKIRRKTGLRGAIQLSRYAEQIGLVPAPSAGPKLSGEGKGENPVTHALHWYSGHQASTNEAENPAVAGHAATCPDRAGHYRT